MRQLEGIVIAQTVISCHVGYLGRLRCAFLYGLAWPGLVQELKELQQDFIRPYVPYDRQRVL